MIGAIPDYRNVRRYPTDPSGREYDDNYDRQRIYCETRSKNGKWSAHDVAFYNAPKEVQAIAKHTKLTTAGDTKAALVRSRESPWKWIIAFGVGAVAMYLFVGRK